MSETCPTCCQTYCENCRNTGRKYHYTLPDGTRVHSEFLDCHRCGKADELVAAARIAHLTEERDIARRAFRLLEEEVARRWISVGDKLPEWAARDDTPCIVNGEMVPPTLTSKTVLVALEGGAVRTDKLITIEGSPPWFDMYRERVTHWQDTPPLPATPSKDTPA